MIEVYAEGFDCVWLGFACTQQQIVASTFASNQQETMHRILTNLPFNAPFQFFNEPTTFAKTTIAIIQNIYDGQDTNIDLALAFNNLPAYTQKILKATAQIPIGYVTSYGLLAEAAGGGARAVGNVMANNPFAPIIPCHRVVRSDFTLGGYGMGLKAKVAFLERETRGFSEAKEVSVNGSNLKVFPAEFVLRNLI